MVEIIYKNNSGDEFTILSEKTVNRKSGNSTYKMVLVKFMLTGYTKWCYKENVLSGKVKDNYKKTRYGVGYLGDIDKTIAYYSQAYQLWANMLKRCYSDDPKGYKKWGTTVDSKWHCLATFMDDIRKLNNFDKWILGKSTGVKYNLDKDFLIPGSNIYSPNTCSFVLESINKSEGAKTKAEGYFRTTGKRLVAEA